MITAELRRLREEAGLTQREFASKLGRPQVTVWRMESGERRIDMLEFISICDLLGVDAPLIYAKLCKQIRDMTPAYPTSESPAELKRVADKPRRHTKQG